MLARCIAHEGPVNTALRSKFTRNQLFRWSRGQKGKPTPDAILVIREVTRKLGPDGPIEVDHWGSKKVLNWIKAGDLSGDYSSRAMREVVQNRRRSPAPAAE